MSRTTAPANTAGMPATSTTRMLPCPVRWLVSEDAVEHIDHAKAAIRTACVALGNKHEVDEFALESITVILEGALVRLEGLSRWAVEMEGQSKAKEGVR